MQRSSAPRSPLAWEDVRLFLALCRARTVGDTARALGIDASTVSRRLAALEAALAVTLFDRGREGIRPTEAAEGLLPIAEEMEGLVSRFSTAAEGLEREVAGVVRITCPPDVAEVVVAPILKPLLARHPALRVVVEPSEAVLDLTRHEADLALRTVRPTRGDLLMTRLTTLRWVLAATPKIAARTLHAWDEAHWVGWGDRFSHLGPARWVAQHAKGIEPIVRSDSLMVQLAVVATGVGVALVPEPGLAHYRLKPVKIAAALRRQMAEWPVNDLFLVTHRALRGVPRIRAVWEQLLTRFATS